MPNLKQIAVGVAITALSIFILNKLDAMKYLS
jgi:hypothetical protein